MKATFDSDVNHVSQVLDSSHADSPSPKQENPQDSCGGKERPSEKQGGSSRESSSAKESGSRRELAAYYNGLASKRRYV